MSLWEWLLEIMFSYMGVICLLVAGALVYVIRCWREIFKIWKEF